MCQVRHVADQQSDTCAIQPHPHTWWVRPPLLSRPSVCVASGDMAWSVPESVSLVQPHSDSAVTACPTPGGHSPSASSSKSLPQLRRVNAPRLSQLPRRVLPAGRRWDPRRQREGTDRRGAQVERYAAASRRSEVVAQEAEHVLRRRPQHALERKRAAMLRGVPRRLVPAAAHLRSQWWWWWAQVNNVGCC